MKKIFWVPITLALAAYLVLPCPGLSAPLSQRIDRSARRSSKTKAQGGRPHHDDPGLLEPHRRAPGRDQRPPQRGSDACSTSLDEQKAELLEVRDRLEVGARPPGAAAHRAGHGAPGARRPAGGDLQGRRARRAHGGARGRRLRRPARARRVPRAHLRPGPRDHGPRARAAGQGGGPGRPSSPSLEQREQLAAERSSASATRSPPRRTSCCRRATSSRRRAPTAAARSPRCARSRDELEGDLARWRREQARVAAALQGAGGRRSPGRSSRAAAS